MLMLMLMLCSDFINKNSTLPSFPPIKYFSPVDIISFLHNAMQGLRRCSDDVVLTPSPPSFSIDAAESAEARIQRLISEHPVIIFSRSSCCMCHVMKKLLSTIGVHPTVIELDDHEISALPPPPSPDSDTTLAPSVFIGGTCIGGLESLVALHLSGHLVPKLVDVGALWV
ncbi:glutaredoxin-C6-like [Euphorbia lathyris]|uniref:glutaredoxin-C6-like n=1 Tax=Euphorbia lathyris TaxID=212925 RepID=UPI003313810F